MYFISPQQTNPAVPDKSVHIATFDFYFTYKLWTVDVVLSDNMHNMYFRPETALLVKYVSPCKEFDSGLA